VKAAFLGSIGQYILLKIVFIFILCLRFPIIVIKITGVTDTGVTDLNPMVVISFLG
jgi:hypothetical protein